MPFIDILGLRVEYQDIAAQPEKAHLAPFVLLHEGLGCITMWRDFPQKLAAATGRRTIVWSRPGYGQSDPWPQPRTPRYMHREAHESVPAFLDALDIAAPWLFGHSDGSSIALLFAAAFPQRVAGLVVLSPHEFVEEITLSGIRAAVDIWNTTSMPQKLARHHRDAQRVFEEWSQCWLSPEFRQWNIEDCLPAITCPVLAIQGQDDEYATMRQIERIAELTPDTRLLKLPNCRHSPQFDQPEAVIQATCNFTQRDVTHEAQAPAH